MDKTGSKTGHFTSGDDPRRGHGKKGRSGRIPDKVKRLASEVADRYALIPMLADLASDTGEETRDRIHAARVVLEYTYQKPTQTIEHSGEILNVHEYRTTLESRMDRLAERIGPPRIPGVLN